MTEYVRNDLTGDLAPVNKELEKVSVALKDKLDRKPELGQANQMEEELDMNGYEVINYPANLTKDSALVRRDQVAELSPVQSVNGQTGDITIPVFEGSTEGITSFASTAEIQGTTPTVTGVRIENRERANAQYVLRENGYVAQPGDLTAANGRVWELQINGKANVLWFGAVADWDGTSGTDNYQSFTDAKDRANHAFVPDGRYRLSRGLRMDKRGFVFECETYETEIVCTADAAGFNTWPAYGVFLLGTYTVDNVDAVPGYSLDAVTEGDSSVTLQTTSEQSNFSVGDVVFVYSDTSYTTDGARPLWGQLARVSDISTGVLSLESQIYNSGSASVKNLSNNNANFITGGNTTAESNFIADEVSILRGSYYTVDKFAPFASGGGRFGCKIDVGRVECNTGPAYGNLMESCEFNVKSQTVNSAPVEFAYLSNNNSAHILSSYRSNRDATTVPKVGAVRINEGSANNTVHVDLLSVSGFDHDAIVNYNYAKGNKVTVNTAISDELNRAVVIYEYLTNADTRPFTEYNTTEILACDSNAPSAVSHTKEGGVFGNKTIINASGTYTRSAFFDNASGNEVVGNIRTGEVLSINGSDENRLYGYFGTGFNTASANYNTTANSFNGSFTSETSNKLKKVNFVSDSEELSNGQSQVITRTVSGGSFSDKSFITLKSSSLIFGGGAEDKTFSFTLGGVTAFSRTTTIGSGDVQVECSIKYISDSVCVAAFTIYENGAIVDTGVDNITGLTLSTDTDLAYTASIAAGSSTLLSRSVVIGAKSGSNL